MLQAFKLIVSDPDSVLNSLTREVKEVGPDGQEVVPAQFSDSPSYFLLHNCDQGFCLVIILQVSKVVPAISEEVKDALVKNIRRRMTPQPLKIRADIEMKCFQFDGVLHIKVILLISSSIFLYA